MDASVPELAKRADLGLHLLSVSWTDFPDSGRDCICWCGPHAKAQLLPVQTIGLAAFGAVLALIGVVLLGFVIGRSSVITIFSIARPKV